MTALVQTMAGATHGGAEAFFTRLALALQRAGQSQTLVIRHNAARAAVLRAGGIEVLELPFGGWLDRQTRGQLRRILTRRQPELVLSWMSRATRATPPGRYVHAARLGGYYDLKYYRACDHLIGNTPDIVTHIAAQGWPRDRVHYLPNFVDAAVLPPVPRNECDTPADAPLLLALGRLHANKGFDILLEALTQVPGAYLWLAGEGPERQALEHQTARLGLAARVRLLGWRDDAAALMAAADLLICPSRHEPLGNVVIEAWAHRLPVIAAAADGPRRLIEHDRSGLLVGVEDAGALARAIAALLSDPARRRALAEAGYAAFWKDYREAGVVAAYLDLFERLT